MAQATDISKGGATADRPEVPAVAPDFIGIGAQKTATTWLDQMLRQNPGAWMPPMKEVHFFNYVHIKGHRGWTNRIIEEFLERIGSRKKFAEYAANISQYERDDPRWYSAVFEAPEAKGKVKGEITPAYSILPKEGVEQVKRFNPEVKILYIVRDPVDRAVSQLRMMAKRKGWPEVGEEVLQDVDRMGWVFGRSSYRETLDIWREVFPPEQFQTLFYADISKNPANLLRHVEGYLGLPEHQYEGETEKTHISKKVAVSDKVVEALTERLTAEREWLDAEFGADWATGKFG